MLAVRRMERERRGHIKHRIRCYVFDCNERSFCLRDENYEDTAVILPIHVPSTNHIFVKLTSPTKKRMLKRKHPFQTRGKCATCEARVAPEASCYSHAFVVRYSKLKMKNLYLYAHPHTLGGNQRLRNAEKNPIWIPFSSICFDLLPIISSHICAYCFPRTNIPHYHRNEQNGWDGWECSRNCNREKNVSSLAIR